MVLVEQDIPGRTAERIEVGDRAGIGSGYFEDFTSSQFRKGLLGLEDRQRAVEAAGIEFMH